MKEASRISEAEWEVMKVVWKQASPSLAQDIIQALAQSTTWSPATIKTMLNRLVGKGALQFERTGKSLPVRTRRHRGGVPRRRVRLLPRPGL